MSAGILDAEGISGHSAQTRVVGRDLAQPLRSDEVRAERSREVWMPFLRWTAAH